MQQRSAPESGRRGPDVRARNLRTALIMASIAAVFFAGIVAKHWLFGGQ
jgi:hypothetical protein